MNRKLLIIICSCLFLGTASFGQELQARLSINSMAVGSKVDKKVFQTLQSALYNLLNNRKWTNESFEQNERIACNFLLNIESGDANVYKATLTVQAARPVYNSNYESPLINFRDDNVIFKYVEYQAMEFNDNRVSGTDPLSSNLTATLAYYVYMILALDFDSFSLRGGDPYFQKAQTIVNAAPESREITGWKAFDGVRNRYWLIENFTNSRYAMLHDAMYNYYRLGMDLMYENETQARTAITKSISLLNSLNNDNGNTMAVQFFFEGRAKEIVNVFKRSTPDEKQHAREMLVKLDITNANMYKQELR